MAAGSIHAGRLVIVFLLQLLSDSSKKHMLTVQFPFELSIRKNHDQSAIIALLEQA